MRWDRHRGEHLRRADVGAAKHSDAAIRLVQLRRPLHRVVTVGALIAKRIKVTARIEASARVLHDHDVSMCGEFVGLLSLSGAVVRRALKQYRKLFIS